MVNMLNLLSAWSIYGEHAQFMVREDFKKKMCKFCDILQIGWGGPGLKTHFKKDRNCDKVFGGVGEKRQCHNFHMLNICCFIGYEQHN